MPTLIQLFAELASSCRENLEAVRGLWTLLAPLGGDAAGEKALVDAGTRPEQVRSDIQKVVGAMICPTRCLVFLFVPAFVPGAPFEPGTAVAGDPSPAYKASLKRTAELRRQRRSSAAAPTPVGVIVPYPMPPSLIIRQTPQVHDEIESLLRLLRGGSN